MHPVLHYEIIGVYTNNENYGAVLASFTETADTIRDAMKVIGNFVDDRNEHETFSWVLREIYEEGSAIVQTGEVSNTDTKVTTTGLISGDVTSEWYQ